MSLFLRLFLVTSLLSLTSACSIFFGDSGVFRSRGKDYLHSGPIKPIEVPEGISVTSLEELYVVPSVEVRDEFGDRVELGEYEVPRPKPITTDRSGVAVKIQSQLGRRWIFLNASTAQVWPQTQSFLSEYDVDVSRSDASKGIIETGWIQFKVDLTMQSRFRIEIAKGIHPDTTEVHVRQVQLPLGATLPEDFSWPESSDDPEREKFIVDQLANALAANVDNKAASLMGQNVGGKDRVDYASVNNEPQLKIRLPWERAYASISASVKNDASFSFWDQDGDRQLLYVGYKPQAHEKKSWFSKLAFWSSDDEADAEAEAKEKAGVSLEQLVSSLEDKPEVRRVFENMAGVGFGQDPGGKGYLLVVQTTMEDGEEVQGVIVRDYRGQKIPARLSKDMLRLLRSNLI